MATMKHILHADLLLNRTVIEFPSGEGNSGDGTFVSGAITERSRQY